MAIKLKLEEIVGDLGATLTREHKHLVPAYSYREVATRWRNLTALINLRDREAEASVKPNSTEHVLLSTG